MVEKIKFHLDENVSNAIAEELRRREVDVTTTPELSLIGVSDLAQLEFAQRGSGLSTNSGSPTGIL